MPAGQFELFQVDIVGPNPADVAFADLAEFVTALQRAVAATQGVADETTATLRLVKIEEGSDRLTLAVRREFVASVSTLSARVRDANYAALPRRAHTALSEMSKVVQRKRWGFRFVRDERLNIAAAEVAVDREIPAPKREAIKGATTILARCMRVGGVEPRVELRLPNRQALLNVDITETLAIQLGSRVYQDVVLAGEATWDPHTWEITEFSVTSISPYESMPLDVSFRELAHAAGRTWDNVDAQVFVREQRAEPDA
jgi:hypothetical protein